MLRKFSFASGLHPHPHHLTSNKSSKYWQRDSNDGGRRGSDDDDDDLNQVAVISTNAAPENVRYGSGSITTVNGPRVVPGIITSSGGHADKSHRIFVANKEKMAIKDAAAADGAGDVQSHFCLEKKVQQQQQQQHPPPPHPAHHHHHQSLNPFERRRKRKQHELIKKDLLYDANRSKRNKSGCNWSFVFDPSGRLCYYWSLIVSIAFLYNFWVLIYRFAFDEINDDTKSTWLLLDGLADLVYILDILVHFRTGFLDEGVLQTDSVKLRQHYMNSTMFYVDALCLLPLDFLYLSIGFNSILRCFRLIKIYRFWAFLDRTERHTNYPNLFRTISLTHYILVIFHWNACVYNIIAQKNWFDGARSDECPGVECDYLHAFYWSTLALTTIGDLPRPRTKREYLFLIIELVSGLFLLATVLGHIAMIVANVSAARKEFQAKLDAVKTYMRMRRVPEHLKIKVIKWFDYLWMTQKSSDEDKCVGILPAKLKAEIAIHVHLDTLKRVEIFQNTEAGFLCALVLRLKPVLFSPGDYVCRKGEVGKEMYIVNRGKLQVVNDTQQSVLATLRAGSYFGEISILNMGTAGNRRTASVRSVGYSDLFCLNKQDMWDVLKDYPAARVRLEAIAVKRLEKYRREPIKKISMGRSRSTPGLVESQNLLTQQQQQQSASTATLLTPDKEQQQQQNEYDDTMKTTSSENNSSEQQQQQSEQQQQQQRADEQQTLQQQHFFQQPNNNNIAKQLHQTTTTANRLLLNPSEMMPYYLSPSPELPATLPLQEQELLVAEIKRLRERLITVEAENASLSIKLNQQQFQVENRLIELEMKLNKEGEESSRCSDSTMEDDERNKESVI